MSTHLPDLTELTRLRDRSAETDSPDADPAATAIALQHSQRMLFRLEPFLHTDPPSHHAEAAAAHLVHARLLAHHSAPAAAHHLRRAIALAEAAPESTELLEVVLAAWTELSRLRPDHGDEHAIGGLTRALAAEAASDVDERVLAAALNVLVKHLHAAGRPGDLLAHSDRALALWARLHGEDLTPHEPWADALTDRVAALTRQRRYADALAFAESAVEMYGLLHDRSRNARADLGNALFNLRICQDETGDHAAAAATARRMIMLYEGEKRPATAHLAEAYRFHGQALGHALQHGRAVASLRRSVQLYEELAERSPDHRGGLVDTLVSLSVVMQRYGDPAAERLALSERITALEDELAAPDRVDARAVAWRNHSIVLDDLGRTSEALAACARSVQEAEAAGQDVQGLELLVDCLDQYAVQLRKSARLDEALACSTRVTELYERLTADNPARYLLEAGKAMDNHAGNAEALELHAEAAAYSERAIAMLDEAGAQSADPNSLGIALGNLANRLVAAGRTAEALDVSVRTLRVRERVAAKAPDSPRAREGHAVALTQRAWVLEQDGRHAEAIPHAEQAVAIMEDLAALDRPQHMPLLAKVSGNLCNYLGEVERFADAAKTARRVVELHEELAAADAARLPDLSDALDSAEYFHHETGQGERFETYARRYAEVADLIGEPRQPGNLADAMHRLARRLKDDGNAEDALEFAVRAAALREPLAAAGDPVDRADLARTLRIVAELHMDAGRRTAADRALRRALALVRALSEEDGPTWTGLLANVLSDAGWVWYDTDPAGALAASAEYLAFAEAREQPDSKPTVLPFALDMHACALARLGRHREAVEAYARALPLWRAIDPGGTDAAWNLAYQAASLAECGRADEAVAMSGRAVDAYRELYAGDAGQREGLAVALRIHAVASGAAGRPPEEACSAVEESLGHLEELAAAAPLAHLPELARTLIAAARLDAGDPAGLFARATGAYEQLEAADPGPFTVPLTEAYAEAEMYAKGLS